MITICPICNGASTTFPCSNPKCEDGKIKELTKEDVMNQLGITEGDIALFPDKVIIKLCLATILNQGVDIATRTLNEIKKFRDLVFGEGYEG